MMSLLRGLAGKASGLALMNPWVLGAIAAAGIGVIVGAILWFNAQLRHAEAAGRAACNAEWTQVVYKNEMARQGERRAAEADQRERGDQQQATDDALDRQEHEAAAENLKMLMQQSHLFIPDVFIEPLRRIK